MRANDDAGGDGTAARSHEGIGHERCGLADRDEPDGLPGQAWRQFQFGDGLRDQEIGRRLRDSAPRNRQNLVVKERQTGTQ